MPEKIVASYRRLLEVRLLHHYWLDQGDKVFDGFGSAKDRERRLLAYDGRGIFEVQPTMLTAQRLKNLGCVFKTTALGFVIAAPLNVAIPTDCLFEFVVLARDSKLMTYTALTLLPRQIVNLAGTQRRYKANVPLLWNQTGTELDIDGKKALFLSRPTPVLSVQEDEPIESLLRMGNSLVQVVHDPPEADRRQTLGPISALPVFVHQQDAPSLNLFMEGQAMPQRGIELTEDVPDDVFALIRLSAHGAGEPDFDFVDGSGQSKDPNPIYQVRFKSRSTFWKYLDKRTGELIEQLTTPRPLTFYGFIQETRKPDVSEIKIETNGARIGQLVSEIFGKPIDKDA